MPTGAKRGEAIATRLQFGVDSWRPTSPAACSQPTLFLLVDEAHYAQILGAARRPRPGCAWRVTPVCAAICCSPARRMKETAVQPSCSLADGDRHTHWSQSAGLMKQRLTARAIGVRSAKRRQCSQRCGTPRMSSQASDPSPVTASPQAGLPWNSPQTAPISGGGSEHNGRQRDSNTCCKAKVKRPTAVGRRARGAPPAPIAGHAHRPRGQIGAQYKLPAARRAVAEIVQRQEAVVVFTAFVAAAELFAAAIGRCP